MTGGSNEKGRDYFEQPQETQQFRIPCSGFCSRGKRIRKCSGIYFSSWENNFTLTDAEMDEIARLNGTKKYYEPDNAAEEKYATMHLPFEAK